MVLAAARTAVFGADISGALCTLVRGIGPSRRAGNLQSSPLLPWPGRDVAVVRCLFNSTARVEGCAARAGRAVRGGSWRDRDGGYNLISTAVPAVQRIANTPLSDMTATLHEAFDTLFRELIDGPPSREAYMLNGGDTGLLRSLDTLSAAAASAVPAAGG